DPQRDSPQSPEVGTKQEHASKRKTRVRRLNHYTGLLDLPLIMHEGLSLGDVPTTYRDIRKGCSIRAPNFTSSTDPLPLHQMISPGTDKTKIRIVVEFEKRDRKLVPYRSLCKSVELRRTLHSEDLSAFWWVYRGMVSP